MKTPIPKQAKKAKKTNPNSLLRMEYSRIWTELNNTIEY